MSLIEERILALGDGFRGFWLLFAASCFIEPHKDPTASAVWQEKVINRIIVLCSKICLCQVDRSQNGDTADALFARYMKHIQRTSVYAKVDTSVALRDGEPALPTNDTAVCPTDHSSRINLTFDRCRTLPISILSWKVSALTIG